MNHFRMVVKTSIGISKNQEAKMFDLKLEQY